MAVVDQIFSRTALDTGGTLDVYYKYDDATLVVSEFHWVNPGPDTGVTVTINGVPFHRAVPTGQGSTPVSGLTLLPPTKPGNSPGFPFTVSVAVD